MCQFCRQLICPPFCPNSGETDAAYGGTRCRNCGAKLPADGFYYLSHEKPYWTIWFTNMSWGWQP